MVPFRDHNVLLNAQVHIPEWQAAKSPGATVVSRVDAQDRVPETVVRSRRILEIRRTETISPEAAGGRVVVSRVAKVSRADTNGILQTAEVGPVGLQNA